jgi:hypothetical protein
MSQSGSPPVLDPTQIDFPPEACADLTILLHQTLACTVEMRSRLAHTSRESQGEDAPLWPIIFAAMIAALDAYSDLVAEHLNVLNSAAGGDGLHDDLVGAAASVPPAP